MIQSINTGPIDGASQTNATALPVKKSVTAMPDGQQRQDGVAVGSSKTQSDYLVRMGLFLNKAQQLFGQKDAPVRQVKDLIQTGDYLKELEKNIEETRSAIDSIVKRYPPFPPGSEDRIRELRSIISIRKQIDQMTIPPPPDNAELARKMSEIANELKAQEISQEANNETLEAIAENLNRILQTINRTAGTVDDAIREKTNQVVMEDSGVNGEEALAAGNQKAEETVSQPASSPSEALVE